MKNEWKNFVNGNWQDNIDVENFIDRLDGGGHFSVPFMLSQMVNQMYLLLENH